MQCRWMDCVGKAMASVRTFVSSQGWKRRHGSRGHGGEGEPSAALPVAQEEDKEGCQDFPPSSTG
ncbi:hypothetical protein ACQJBY_048478 [Aegilops geniculata]